MNKKTWTALAASIVVFAAGLFVTLQTRADAIVKGASGIRYRFLRPGPDPDPAGSVGCCCQPAAGAEIHRRADPDPGGYFCGSVLRRIYLSAHRYSRGYGKNRISSGNVFCVLAALFVGGFWGGMAGSIGMTWQT